MSETETPFRPREKLIEKQKYFQSLHRHTYLKGPYDKITSVVIPLALAGASLFMIRPVEFINNNDMIRDQLVPDGDRVDTTSKNKFFYSRGIAIHE